LKNLKLISLGAWCRPAYQIGCYVQGNTKIEGLKGPFDWTITSFQSLKICLQPEFDPKAVLDPNSLACSFARSGMCEKSGVIFHHAIDPKTLENLGVFDPGDKIPRIDALDPIIDSARGRFSHTFSALDSLRAHKGQILFVRWRRHGHPDPEYPSAFEGETGLVALTFRSLNSFKQPFVQKPTGFYRPRMNVVAVDCRTH